MQKKYIIAVVLTALLWGGFMFYRHNKKEQGGADYRQKMNAQIMEMAKKSPRAGLSRIGEALTAYYRDNNEYPASLMDLYPDYIDYEPFLTKIDWHYEPRGGNDFFITKTIILGNKRLVASMDNSLRPRSEKGIMVATPTLPAQKKKAQMKTSPVRRAEISDEKRLEMARENFLNALREGRLSVTEVSLPDSGEERLLARVMPRVLSVSDHKGEGYLEAELGQHYLVWKETNGVLGFGNTQYPREENLSIFNYGRWYHIVMPEKEKSEKAVSPPPDKKGSVHWAEAVTTTLDDGYVAWKDGKGIYGFGNRQYPRGETLAVFNLDQWVRMENRPRPSDTPAPSTTVEEEKKSTEQIASAMAQEWLVWKDDRGIYGFGDRQYPEQHVVSVRHDDNWVALQKSTGPLDMEDKERPESDPDHEKSDSELASQFSSQCLVWKDSNGTMGFGNLQYPEQGLGTVFQDDGWVDLEKHRIHAKKTESSNNGPEEGKSRQENDSLLNGPFLVWKTSYGTLGFGNLEYPNRKEISHIRIDGGWEPVTH